MRARNASGRIVTFYSYKGGVGRSMLLANIAWVLAFAGKRVLVVDWDLEAPGIEHYFRPWLPDGLDGYLARPGVIDQLCAYRELAESRLRLVEAGGDDLEGEPGDPTPSSYFQADWEPEADDIDGLFSESLDEDSPQPGPGPADDGNSFLFDSPRLRARRAFHAALGNFTVELEIPDDWAGEIHIIPAGCQEDPVEYAGRVATFDWDGFYTKLEGQRFLSEIRYRMRAYDYVLIDSRTGISRTSAVTAIEFADDLVACFGLGDQSIEGVAGAVETFLASRAGEPTLIVGEPPRVFPVPMRVDRQLRDRYGPAQQRYERIFNPHVLKLDQNIGEYWANIEIPYEKNYAFEELAGPAAGMDPYADAYAIACKRLAGLVAPEVVDTSLLDHLNDVMSAVWRTADKAARRTMEPAFGTAVISYVDEDRPWAVWLGWVAENRGLLVIPHPASREPVGKIQAVLGGREDFCLIPVLSSAYLDNPNGKAVLHWGQKKITRLGDRRLRPVKVELDINDSIAQGAFGLDLLDLDAKLALRAVADLLTVPIGSDEAAVAEQFEGATADQPGTDLATAPLQPDFPGDVLPSHRYAQLLEEARRSADYSSAISNGLRLAVEIALQGRMSRSRQLFAEAARLSQRQDLLTRIEVLAEWAATERRYGNPGIADRHLVDADRLLVEAAGDGARADRPRYRRLAARVELERVALLRDSPRLADQDEGKARVAAVRLGASERNDQEILADAIAQQAEHLAAQGLDEEAWRNFVEARYLYAALGDAAGQVRAELGLGELAGKVDGPQNAARYYGDAYGRVDALDEKDWEQRYAVERRRADAEFQAGLVRGNRADRARALSQARDHYERALYLATEPDPAAAGAVGGEGRPEDRRPLRTRQPNLWFGAATGLANVLDALARLEVVDAAALRERGTRLRIRAVEQLDWTEVDPRYEHGEALRAGRGGRKLPASRQLENELSARRQLENATLAFYVFNRIRNQPQADKERAWIRDNRGGWGLADLEEFLRKMLDPAEAREVVEKLTPVFRADRGIHGVASAPG